MSNRLTRAMARCALLLAAIAPAAALFGQQDDAATRIEYEAKLKVPIEQTEQVWDWLEQRYADCGWLNTGGHDFTAGFGDEDFTDVYFDTPGLHVLAQEGGVRHRSRVVHSGPSYRKDGRELLQLKINRGDEAGLARSEVKYKIVERQQGQKDDAHPLLGLIDRDDRQDCIARLAALGLDARAMRPVVTLKQNRRRVYVNDADGAFATITLDACSTDSWGADVRWTEIELELNEIRFTKADPAERAGMKEIDLHMQRDLQEAFPGIVQDQTSKYTHSLEEIERTSWLPIKTLIGLGIGQDFLLLIVVAAGAGVVGLAGAGWKRLRTRRRAASNAAAAA